METDIKQPQQVELDPDLCLLLSLSVPKKAIMMALPILFLCIHASD